MDVFRVRLNCIDHYQATPTQYDPQLRNDIRPSQLSKEPRVPVVRVFGSTETGQKVCAHIHGAFPYLFVEYNGSLQQKEVGAYILRLHLSIDHALAVSFRRDPRQGQHKFVARITLVKGVPFYGFHVGYRYYLKIYMLNPIVMTRLADILQQGLVMNRKFQPYEAHLQYLLQFMTDYNLYGCSYIETRKVMFRYPVPQHEDGEDAPHLWHSQSILPGIITNDSSLPRTSHCSIEVDICVQDILNRHEVKEWPLHHDFGERLHPIPQDVKLVNSMAGLWKDETKRRKRRIGDTDPSSSPFPPEVMVSMSADRNSQPSGWIHEDEYREQIQHLVEQEEEATGEQDISFDNFVKPEPFENTVKTIFQSVEDLYPENLLPALGLDRSISRIDVDPASSIQVDENGIRKFDDDREYDDNSLYADDSNDEVIRKADDTEESKNTLRNAQGNPARAEATLLQESSTGSHSLSLGVQNQLGSFAGVCLSAMRTGKLPQMPIFEELLAEARSEGLVSKLSSARRSTSTEKASPKRPGTPLEPASPSKRCKLSPVDVSTREIGSDEDQAVDISGAKRLELSLELADADKLRKADLRAHTSSKGVDRGDPAEKVPLFIDQKASHTSGTSKSARPSQSKDSDASRRRGNQTLKFSVVKDPNDPSTRMRLSQQSGSQQSEDGTSKQHVVFRLPPPPEKITPSIESEPTQSVESSTPKLLPTSLSAISGYKASPTEVFVFEEPPPSVDEVYSTMQDYGLPDVIYQDAFYGNEKDVPARKREYAGREFKLESNTLPFLPEFDATGQSPATFGIKNEAIVDRSWMQLEYEQKRKQCTIRNWELADLPPSFDEVNDWWEAKQNKSKPGGSDLRIQPPPPPTQDARPYLSQIVGATPKNKHGFKYSQKPASTSVQHEAQYMSTMSLEIHVNTRGKLFPNPEEDEVQCIFWCLKSDEAAIQQSQAENGVSGIQAGVVLLSPDGSLAERVRKQAAVSEVLEETSELDVLVRMVEVVRVHDPDILTGFEVHGSSWGYLIERARVKYDYDLYDEFSRVKSDAHGRMGKDVDRWGFNKTSSITVTGRHMINIWRAMRGELNLLQYTMENVSWHLLHRRIPHYSWQTLTDWYKNGRHRDLSKVLRYYLTRTRLDIEILEANELVPRTSEQARLLGVDFFSVFSRGSQFKVESIMSRIARPENFVLVSPSKKQVGGQNALECLPLVMEPQSAFYSSPMVVLDFQSLYPSVMIAYNYCYSTFLGRIVNWRGMNKMGFTEYERHQGLLRLLKDHVNIAPNGIMYAKPEIRKSLLAKMLTEILETRVMVKSGMKEDKEDRTLQLLLNNRQLALKLLANVTYGYTSASFSGRMPCSEIADSIVQTGRETLERTIAFIHSVERWGAEVVYGDTDSLFVHLRGRTRAQAFDIGAEMARAVTAMNPRPVKLKFEKVYHPCVLLAKKRYVGYKYETPDQTAPEFDAKGIETVRRDGTPAEQKIEEKALRLLFETADLSRVKAYFQAQCAKILRGAVSVQDFCFAREVKLGNYASGPGAGPGAPPPPPGALISTRRMLADARAEPQYGERVPYVVVTGAPGARLVDRCVAPEDLLANPHWALDAHYYIDKNIVPPLERIFNLVGANVRAWFDEMPRVHRVRRVDPAITTTSALGGAGDSRKVMTLESFLRSTSCVACGAKMKAKPTATAAARRRPGTTTTKEDKGGGGGGQEEEASVCGRCRARRRIPATAAALRGRLGAEERRLAEVLQVCRSCAGLAPLDDVRCDSRDCPVFYTRAKQASRLRTERAAVEPALRYLEARAVAGGNGNSNSKRAARVADLDW